MLATPTPTRTWSKSLKAITAYVRKHHGRFPPTTRGSNPRDAELGSWWVAQNLSANIHRMTEDQLDQLRELRQLAANLREQQRERRNAEVAAASRRRARAAVLVAGRAGALAARTALESPYLLPGDDRILRLRIAHPDKSLAELGKLADLTTGGFANRYYGALNRTANSRRPLKKPLAEQVLTPGAAAEVLGVARVTLSRWADAGLVQAARNSLGHRQYAGAEVLRVRAAIAQGWPPEFEQAAQPRRKRQTPGAAAEVLGVARVTLSRWADAGLVQATRNSLGHRQYAGAEVLRVRAAIAQGWPPEFEQAAQPRRKRQPQ